MNLTELFHSIVTLSLLGSITAAGLFLIKLLLRRKLSANWHYAIWFILILRLVIPFTPSAPFNVLNFIPHYQQMMDSASISMPDWQGTSSNNLQPGNTSNLTGEMLSGNEKGGQPPSAPVEEWFYWDTAALIWLGGVLAISLYVLLVNGILLLKTRKLPVCVSSDIISILQACKADLQVHSEVSVVYDDSPKSPALFGLFRPKIVISPDIVERLSPEELRHIFLHELSHLKRHDLQVSVLVLAIRIIYWFNPFIWFALYQMKRDCEIACDATVLSALKPQDHKKYGQTIIRLMQLLSEPHWVLGTLGFVSKFNARRIIMISKFKKTTLKWAVVALVLTLVVGCSSLSNPINPPSNGQNQQDTNAPNLPSLPPDSSNVYQNTQYGFSFSLPESWQGYSIVESQWEGLSLGSQTGEPIVETGPLVSIRDPRWTSQTPRQDIPIMVFTLAEWNSLQQGVFHIGAAPIGPSELGRNNTYVFALPARYNYAFPVGYEEVETILAGKPLLTTQVSQQHPDATESLLLNMMAAGEQGKVLFCDFPVKTTSLQEVEKAWGKADQTDYVAAAKGRYATYSSHNVVFGINKGDQIFEVRSSDSRLKGITLAEAKTVLGTPAYNAESNGQEIIGYTTNSEFKVEMVFPQPTSEDPNPVIDHYNVLYPSGTVNSMADDPGRQW
ncbi:MAG: antirepressor [Gracilibacter sp. BRH_c7a]|nr:MAG: antirepressor [Gracilibacter sp. BRH_c7a]